MTSRARLLAAIGVSVLVTGCFIPEGRARQETLAPVPPPERIVPFGVATSDAPPASGTTHVIFDSTDGPTRVQLMLRAGAPDAPSCISPCALDLPAGEYQLGFTRQATARAPAKFTGGGRLRVAHDPVVYRRTPAFVETHDAEQVTGFVIADTGSLLVALALEEATFHNFMDDDAIGATALVGVGLYIVGGLVFGHGRRVSTHPGSEVQFSRPAP